MKTEEEIAAAPDSAKEEELELWSALMERYEEAQFVIGNQV